jgi:hypothetical protein
VNDRRGTSERGTNKNAVLARKPDGVYEPDLLAHPRS